MTWLLLPIVAGIAAGIALIIWALVALALEPPARHVTGTTRTVKPLSAGARQVRDALCDVETEDVE